MDLTTAYTLVISLVVVVNGHHGRPPKSASVPEYGGRRSIHWPVPLARQRLGKSGFRVPFSGTKPSAWISPHSGNHASFQLVNASCKQADLRSPSKQLKWAYYCSKPAISVSLQPHTPPQGLRMRQMAPLLGARFETP